MAEDTVRVTGLLLFVTLAHRRVESSDDNFQLWQLEPCIGSRLFELVPLDIFVKLAEELDERLPLGPVWLLGLLVVSFAFSKIRLAQIPIDVVIARNHQDSVTAQLQMRLQTEAEVVDVVELLLLAPLGQVPRERNQVRIQSLLITELVQVVGQPLQERVEFLIGPAQTQPPEAVFHSKLHVRYMENRNRRSVRRSLRPFALRLSHWLRTVSFCGSESKLCLEQTLGDGTESRMSQLHRQPLHRLQASRRRTCSRRHTTVGLADPSLGAIRRQYHAVLMSAVG